MMLGTETESHRRFSTPGKTAEGRTSSNNEGSTLTITKHIATYFSLLREKKKVLHGRTGSIFTEPEERQPRRISECRSYI
jgi:hypothetical protein